MFLRWSGRDRARIIGLSGSCRNRRISCVDRGSGFVAPRREKPVQVDARRDDPHLLGPVVVVQSVLGIDFLLGAGDDQIGVTQGRLLGGDAAADVVLLLELLPSEAAGQQAPALDPAQGMAGVDQRDAPAGRPATSRRSRRRRSGCGSGRGYGPRSAGNSPARCRRSCPGCPRALPWGCSLVPRSRSGRSGRRRPAVRLATA